MGPTAPCRRSRAPQDRARAGGRRSAAPPRWRPPSASGSETPAKGGKGRPRPAAPEADTDDDPAIGGTDAGYRVIQPRTVIEPPLPEPEAAPVAPEPEPETAPEPEPEPVHDPGPVPEPEPEPVAPG